MYFLALALIAAATAGVTPPPKTFKICVPDGAYAPCLQMVEQGKSVGVEMTCVAARDRVDCMTKMKEHEADFEAVDPEDLYIAYKRFGGLFKMFEEIRTKEEPDNEFRYEAVVVIHKDLDVKSIASLRGLKSCHTGVGRNVGYKIPITKLTKMGILPPLNNTKMSPRENELKALSTFFSKSCIVGKWSPDKAINQRLKRDYSNLCQLCEFPDKCDYPDKNSGYEGALRCLADAGGDVAFTKVIFVKKFFGMAYGTQPPKPSEHNPNDFAYLCPDASKKPIVGEPCIWAARPWQGYMTPDSDEDDVAQLRVAITKLNELGESTHASWIASVLALNNVTLAKANKGPYTAENYLEKAKYLDVIERDVLKPRRYVRLCVSTNLEFEKCEDLSIAAYSRDIRPSLTCVAKNSLSECFQSCKKNEVDVVHVDPGYAVNAVNKYDLQPVLKEDYESEEGHPSPKTTAVGVVKKSSTIKSWEDMKGHKACFSRAGEAAGWVIPLHQLVSKGLIEQTKCPYADFFSAVSNSENPFKCLSSDAGEVAFMDYDTLLMNVDGGELAGNAVSGDYELVCKEGGRKPVSQYASCNLGKVPPKTMLASKHLEQVEKDDILFTMLNAADTFHIHPEYFRQFGWYRGHPNVIFSNAAIGLESASHEHIDEYAVIHNDVKACNPDETAQ